MCQSRTRYDTSCERKTKCRAGCSKSEGRPATAHFSVSSALFLDSSRDLNSPIDENARRTANLPVNAENSFESGRARSIKGCEKIVDEDGE
jgi:hypothetical protein